MTFDEVLAQMTELLQREGRVTYRALKRRFALDDDYLEDLKGEIIKAKRLAVDEDGEVLVWTGNNSLASSVQRLESKDRPPTSSPQTLDPRPSDSRQDAAERRQLTVMFCDLVGSTTLSQQLDPEDYHARVVAYQAACHRVIARYDGHIAQYLGDGILVYFGYPAAHEDDAARAVRTGLEIVEALAKQVPSPLVGEGQGEGVVGARRAVPLQVRIGIHTGPVVVGAIGAGERTERLALGETPNIAARVQGQARPDTVVMSDTTHRLVQGLFEYQDLGPQTLKGVSTPLSLYRVIGEGAAHSRFEAAVRRGLTPLVGREEELSVLQRRWEQTKTGTGQVVLLSGEPGIGKSRLVQELKERVGAEGANRIEFRCSPYHQNSALYPIIGHLQRLLQFTREDTPTTKLEKLQHTLSRYRFPQGDTVPLLAALLSFPHPEGYPPITVSPQKQKEKTQEALVAWIIEEAEKAPVYCAWEDVHWADPSTLEVLTLLFDQVPTTRLLALLTFRPEFASPWGNRSHLNQLTLSRLGRNQAEAMVKQVVRGTALPAEVVQQIVVKTDGVPLFVEELTKSVVESVGATGRSPLQALDIPATLQDSLMARLDRLNTAKEIAQLGAAIGREFSYELLHAVSPLGEETLQQGLRQLVEAELVYQRGLPPQATYLFKHALIQDTASQSLLKSRRQHLHRQIAHILEERFPDTKAAQPELLAYHYTEANLLEQAIPYWQLAGWQANGRSANQEAINHSTKGLELLETLSKAPERDQLELRLQLTLAGPLMVTRGYAAPELESVYARVRELSQQLGETPELVSILYGLAAFYLGRAELHTSREFTGKLLALAQRLQDPLALLMSHFSMAVVLHKRGEFVEAQEHAKLGIELYDHYRSQPSAWQAHHFGVGCLYCLAWVLWLSGYPDQARKKAQEAFDMAHKMAQPMTRAEALGYLARFSQNLREQRSAEEQANAMVVLCTEQGFPLWRAEGIIVQGWALVERGQEEEGMARIRQGLADYQDTGTALILPDSLAMLAAVYLKRGQTEEGLKVVTHALGRVKKTEGRLWEAELYRLKGQLVFQSEKSRVGIAHPTEDEAEACFLKAIEVARKQQAKALELRATMSLARLWQRQGKQLAARMMLSEIYNWFTEGFDTKDLQEAKALIEELSHGIIE